MTDIDREICAARDALAEADDASRASRLNQLGEAYQTYACEGGEFAAADALTGSLLHALAAVERRVNGASADWWFQGGEQYDEVLERMAAEPDIARRADMLHDLCLLIDDETARESIACLPYAPGMVGWSVQTYLPASFPKMVRAVWRSWRAA